MAHVMGVGMTVPGIEALPARPDPRYEQTRAERQGHQPGPEGEPWIDPVRGERAHHDEHQQSEGENRCRVHERHRPTEGGGLTGSGPVAHEIRGGDGLAVAWAQGVDRPETECQQQGEAENERRLFLMLQRPARATLFPYTTSPVRSENLG